MVDAAASLGTFVDGKFSGFGADFCCWSFDAMKLLICGEGGGAYFKDQALAEKFKEYTYLGLSTAEKSGLDRSESGEIWWEYQPVRPGRRSVFTNINAAIGLPQIPKIDSRIARRAHIRDVYLKAFEELPGISVIKQHSNSTSYANYFFSMISERRNELAFFLKENGIYSTFRYSPTHRMRIFRPYSHDCPNCDKFSNTALNIPIHDSLSDQDVAKISSLIVKFFGK